MLVGLALFALAAVLLLRGVSTPRARAVETLGHIDSYGFTKRSVQKSSRRPLTKLLAVEASWHGDADQSRIEVLDETALRNMLNGPGLYQLYPRKFTGSRLLSTIALPGLWLLFGLSNDVNSLLLFAGTVLLVPGGWRLPLILVRARARRRLDKIDYELPELIDLLVVTVEAGVGFVQSLQIASVRLGGPLGDELRLVLQEQAMGLGDNEALRNMLLRCETPTVRSFVRSILQGETLGVSIGQIMRNLAQEMRKRRRAHAEERAQKAPIKLLFPLVFLIFPAMFVILLGPAVLTFMASIGG